MYVLPVRQAPQLDQKHLDYFQELDKEHPLPSLTDDKSTREATKQDFLSSNAHNPTFRYPEIDPASLGNRFCAIADLATQVANEVNPHVQALWNERLHKEVLLIALRHATHQAEIANDQGAKDALQIAKQEFLQTSEELFGSPSQQIHRRAAARARELAETAYSQGDESVRQISKYLLNALPLITTAESDEDKTRDEKALGDFLERTRSEFASVASLVPQTGKDEKIKAPGLFLRFSLL